MPVRKTVARRSDTTGLSPAEKLSITGAKYETVLPPGANKFEWLELHSGNTSVISQERRDYLKGLMKYSRVSA